MTIFITGGAGFIGSNFVHNWINNTNEEIVNLDLLTYAGNLSNLKKFAENSSHIFIKGNILDKSLITEILKKYNPRALINFAAESHVDRSINNPQEFIQTNIVGTYNLLECSYDYWSKLSNSEKNKFRFLQISTDEVFGSLEKDEPSFTENSSLAPNSPYSASKASADHLVRAFNKTFNLPTIITNCSNNYGPYQYPEKFIPLVLNNALRKKKIPIYGDGLNIRDWLFVKDHCIAITEILNKGETGETYNIGGGEEKTNNEVVYIICEILDQLRPLNNDFIIKYSQLISYVKDRPGHDRRYSINFDKLKLKLKWQPKYDFRRGILETINWYIDNQEWVDNI